VLGCNMPFILLFLKFKSTAVFLVDLQIRF
jgi:hypothetical protein